MCYSGKCYGENYFGDCQLTSDEIRYLEKNFNVRCLIPSDPEEEDIPFDDIIRELNDYRDSKVVINKLLK